MTREQRIIQASAKEVASSTLCNVLTSRFPCVLIRLWATDAPT